MARLHRIAPLGIPQHIIQRGNNRQVCFASEQDLALYASMLEEYSRQYSVAVHAWVFMTNHVHLLVTPHETSSISNMMQAVGRRYVRYFNREYQRSGTLWEGRYGFDPADYVWSSYQCHALGKAIKMSTPHEEYLRLDTADSTRQSVYRSLFAAHVDEVLLNDIRQAVNKGPALGNDKFKDELESLYGRRVKPARMGRPSSRRK